MLYQLMLTVFLLNGDSYLVPVDGAPLMTREQCQREAQNQLENGFEMVVCRPIKPGGKTQLNLPSGRVVYLEKSGVNAWVISTPAGRRIIPEDMHPDDFAAFLWTLEKMQPDSDLIAKTP